MGWYKQQQIEELSQGYDNPPDKCVCAKHFRDASLRDFVNSNAELGNCDYCDRKDGHSQVIPMETLVAHMHGIISEWYTDPDNEGVPYSSSWVDDGDDDNSPLRDKHGYVETKDRTVYDADELFEEIGLNVDNGELETDIIDCFRQHLWADQDYFSFTVWEELDFDWKEFCRKIKSSEEYSYMNLPPLDKEYFSENGLSDILTEIGNIIHNYRLIKRLSPGEIFYRVRNHSIEKDVSNFKELASPPPFCVTSPNRMSPTGVSMFYASNDLDTSLKEAQGTSFPDQAATWGEFELTHEIDVIDFTDFPKFPGFWSGIERETLQTIGFLYAFADKISKPVGEKDKIKEYLPTQIMTGYLEKVFTDGNTKINGMIFYSSKEKGIKNYVLFLNDQKCPQYLKLNHCKTIDKK